MNDGLIAEAARQIACSKRYFVGRSRQGFVTISIVSTDKYNLLCTPISKAVEI